MDVDPYSQSSSPGIHLMPNFQILLDREQDLVPTKGNRHTKQRSVQMGNGTYRNPVMIKHHSSHD